MKKHTAIPDGPRKQWIRCRVNEVEAAQVAAWLESLTPDTATREAAAVAARVRAGAPFETPAAFLRAVLGLPEIRVGAREGNRNAVRKK